MNKNVGGADKVVRIVAGLAIIGVGIYYGSWWGAIGAVLLLTGVTGICPGYMPFGVSTCGRDKEPQA